MIDIDVVIPMRNGEKYILRALTKVFSQTHPAKNVIVIDDGSTDGGAKIVNKLQEQFLNLKLIQTPPRGLSAARNLGIMNCQAKFVALLDCDDYWTESKLEHQADFLEQNKESVAVFSNCFIHDEMSGKIYVASKNEHSAFSAANLILQKYRVIGSASSICLNVEIAKKLNLFSEELSYGEDYDFWIRISKKYFISEIPYRDVYITKRSDSMQTRTATGLDRFRNSLMYFKVWTRNNIDFQEYNSEFKKLIWPDIRRSIVRHPFDFAEFLKELKNRYSQESSHLLGNFPRIIIYISEMTAVSLIRILTKSLKKVIS